MNRYFLLKVPAVVTLEGTAGFAAGRDLSTEMEKDNRSLEIGLTGRRIGYGQ